MLPGRSIEFVLLARSAEVARGSSMALDLLRESPRAEADTHPWTG